MGVTITAVYTGDLHCEVEHGPSASKVTTDAPKDNMGRGELFSPTDLVGAALTSCVLTTMGIVAKRDGIPFEGARAETVKEMSAQAPRRIGSLHVRIAMPKGLTEPQRQKLENAARTCPVHRSLHPDVKAELTFAYD
jgi:putative redox protein